LPNLRNLTCRDPSARRLDQEVAKPLNSPHVIRQPHDDVETTISIDDAGDDPAVRQAAQPIDDRTRLKPVERRPPVVDADFNLRDQNLTLDLKIREALDSSELDPKLLSDTAHRVQVL